MSEPETLIEHFEQYQEEHHSDEGHPREPAPQLSPQSVAEQLNSLLMSADGTARRIVQEAEARAKSQLAEADRKIRWMEAETARMASWSQQTEQMLQALSTAVGEFRRDVEAIPDRISEALNPLASHVPVLVRQMEELMGALTAPPSNAGGPPPPTGDSEAMVTEHSEAMVSEHSVEAGWGEGWDHSGNGSS
jgi:hypothetical protein